MNDLTGERIGFVVTGSFCTFSAAFAEAAKLRAAGAKLTPIFSEHAAGTDTRFGKAADRVADSGPGWSASGPAPWIPAWRPR